MMNEFEPTPRKGLRRSFPRHRQIILDILRASAGVPSFPVHRTMPLGPLAQLRSRSSMRIGWTTLFAKAYALVSQALPELRELYVTYPWNYLYRHPHSVSSLSIHRLDDAGNERLIFGRWVNAESMTLPDLQDQLDSFCTAPLAQVYRDGCILERRSALVRRFVWWWTMKCSGRNRAKYIGTFSISSLGGQGALNAHHPLITTSSLAFGPIDEQGNCQVVLICDHRAIDGVLAAKALQCLEDTMVGQIATELQSLPSLRAAA